MSEVILGHLVRQLDNLSAQITASEDFQLRCHPPENLPLFSMPDSEFEEAIKVVYNFLS